MTQKLCRKCGRWLPLAEFQLLQGSYRSPCRQCRSITNANWHARHKAYKNAYNRAYNRKRRSDPAFREQERARQREAYRRDPEGAAKCRMRRLKKRLERLGMQS